jgi:hypothetical protein
MTLKKIFVFFALLTFSLSGLAQETTGALQGTVKDATGAVVPNAVVTVTTPTLVGVKTAKADSKGYYRFENLPPGEYTETVEMPGFATVKRTHILVNVGTTPSVDVKLAVGAATTTVEVSAGNPAIDVTSTTTTTTVSTDVIDFVPRGQSYQSVIQFAPAARQEPLMGSSATNGTGGTSPGSATNGGSFGFSVAGGSDSENSYLVEGQETANLIGGYSKTNVPFDFIDQVEIKSSGVEAEYGGALGGVVNVIMKKGSSNYHGSVYTGLQFSAFEPNQGSSIGYDPLGSPSTTAYIDAPVISYQPKKDHWSDIFPGFTLGGPLLPFSGFRDKVFFFVGFSPEMRRYERTVNYSQNAKIAGFSQATTGSVPFSQNTNTYYTTARIDAQATSKIHVFGSWLYQYQRQVGENLPGSDSTNGIYNTSAGNPLSLYNHAYSYSAPNQTINAGGDVAITPRIISTTRFGYYFENYHDDGFPTGSVVHAWQTNGTGTGATDTNGVPLSVSAPLLAQPSGHTDGTSQQITQRNSNKAIQLDETVSWTKSGWYGVHNFKFGYQLNRDSNDILQAYNQPLLQLYVAPDGGSNFYQPQGPVGAANCAAAQKITGQPYCDGTYGYANIFDYGTGGKAISYNHGIFFQDSWTLKKGVTLYGGMRIEKEYLPGDAQGAGVPSHPINFGWGDKLAPRVGAAWDVFQNGKLKMFGGYGVYNDQMKLNLAISSFGGQYWNNCAYSLFSNNPATIKPAFSNAAVPRDCPGGTSATPGNLSASAAPDTFLENINNRANPTTCATCTVQEEGVAPGLKPYRQHESDFGVSYQASRTITLEARWDRRRLDHVIEDAAIFNPLEGETFVIINPGQGVDDTFQDFCNFLYTKGGQAGCFSSNDQYPPPNAIPAARSYDGIELSVTRAASSHWAGKISYTYSHFRGNYTGLTTSDISDGRGRNAPNNSRSFDEPYFQFDSYGGSSSGLLPTDRPNAFKGYGYYRLGFLKHFTTDFGIFQTLYSGSPNTSYASVGYSENAFFQQVEDRGKWADLSQDPTTGFITVGNRRTYRNPWYNQTDFNIDQQVKLGGAKSLTFQATFTNVLNQHTVTSVNEQMDSPYSGSYFLSPGGYYIADGPAFYAAAMHPYNLTQALNGIPVNTAGTGSLGTATNDAGGPIQVSGLYGKPYTYQSPRNIRLGFNFTF